MFSVTGMQTFSMFNTAHIVTLLLFFFIFFGIIFYRKQLKPYQSIIKWILFYSLIACEVSQHVWLILTNQWTVADLPLQVCSLSTFIILFLCFKKSQKAFELLYFIGTLPAILSMVTPDLLYQFPHFRFLEYFLHHSVIPLSALYFIVFENYRVPFKAVLRSFITLNIIAVPIFFLNQLLDTNFFFLASPSETKTLLSFFGTGITYNITLEIVGIVVFFLTYWPMGVLQRREKQEVYRNR